MLGLVKSCIGTKFTGQFGDLIAVSILFVCDKFSVKRRYECIWLLIILITNSS